MIYPISVDELDAAIRALNLALIEGEPLESCAYAVLDAVAYKRGEFKGASSDWLFEGEE